MGKKDDVVEPSEIIVDQPDEIKADHRKVNPWIRCLSRFFDYALFYLFFGWLFGWSKFSFFYVTFAWVPIEAVFLYFWSTTPGKYLLKSKVEPVFHFKLSFKTALRRSISVWVRGMGLGLPIIVFFTLFFSYYRLEFLKITSWDRDEKTRVVHRPVSLIRIFLVIVFIVVSAFISYKGVR